MEAEGQVPQTRILIDISRRNEYKINEAHQNVYYKNRLNDGKIIWFGGNLYSLWNSILLDYIQGRSGTY